MCDTESRVLILGTMPSPASFAAGMYYSHPRNAFWRILGDLSCDDPGMAPESRRAFALRHGVALWDTLGACEREGALDGDIMDERPNDVAGLVRRLLRLRAVFLNGGAAYKYYRRYHAAKIDLPYALLPSTSPANARGGYARKLEAWRCVADYLL